MKLYTPTYYPAFRCIASACRHSCCVGWEIDVDAETYARYQKTEGALGDRLRREIEAGDPPHFRLTEGDRCPFLDRDGLCEIILSCGEEALCRICADHPRYRNLYSDRVEMGLGLSCEAVADLLLSWQDPVEWVPVDGKDTPTEEETAFFALRGELVSLLQDRTRPLTARLYAVADRMDLPTDAPDPVRLLGMYLPLESMTEEWRVALTSAIQAGGEGSALLDAAEYAIPFEQLAVYFIDRYLPDALTDDGYEARVAFALLSVWAIAALHPYFDTLAETARLYSAEIEYSDQNVSVLLDAIDEHLWA